MTTIAEDGVVLLVQILGDTASDRTKKRKGIPALDVGDTTGAPIVVSALKVMQSPAAFKDAASQIPLLSQLRLSGKTFTSTTACIVS